MIDRELLDNYIDRQGPIRIAIAGAGYMAKGLLAQIHLSRGIEVVAMASRNADKVRQLLNHNNMKDVLILDSVLDLPTVESDIVVDLTGDVELGVKLALGSIEARRHILINAEADATVGPVLGAMAKRQGLVYTSMWGDEPALIKGLYDYASILGFQVHALGKFKGYQNHASNPDTVSSWAQQTNQNPYAIASFADGTKLAMEMCILSNGTDMVPDVEGMHMREARFEDVLEMMKPISEGGMIHQPGVIEVFIGPQPGGAVFAIIYCDDPEIMSSLRYYKMGEGPYYMLYYPYHMPGIEMIYGLYEMMILGKSSLKPIGVPVSDVCTIAKRNLKAGETLDAIGGYDYFGKIIRAKESMEKDYLPVGMAKDAVLLCDIMEGEHIRMSQVRINNHRMTMKLRLNYQDMLKGDSDVR